MKQETINAAITVVGGGLAGICAAISAARLGKKVSLVQNRPVLGGNSSSEVRVWVCSATKHGVNRYARETGIMGELFVENQFRNREGNPYIWDALLLEKVLNEPNIELFLNTDVTDIETSNENTISSVTGWMQGSERRLTFISEVYIDCTGDGLVGALADIEYVLGREAASTYDETLAPAVADQEMLGSTLLFYTKDVGHEVDYHAPAFAKNILETPIPENRIIKSGDSGSRYWWIEWGGEIDIVHDNERIRDELMGVIFGIWDYIKNSGKFDAKNLTLEWVGSVPGKREYRRFIGEYVLTQKDIEEQTLFDDRIGFGGWSIDLHPATGMYTENAGARHSVADGVYHIPYRMLYSQKINNFLFAGRNVSASHVAFGSIRIMATCALMGEAVGTAASLMVTHESSAHDVYLDHLVELQQTLLKNDGSLLGIANTDATDLALQAEITVSNTLKKIDTYTKQADAYSLSKPVAFTAPINPSLDGMEVLVNVLQATELEAELWDTGNPQNYIPNGLIQRVRVPLEMVMKLWVSLPCPWTPEQAQNGFFILNENPDMEVYLGNETFAGVLSYEYDVIAEMKQPELHSYIRESPVLYWTNQTINRRNFIFNLTGVTEAFIKDNLMNGLVRPYGGPNMWVTNFNGKEEQLTYSWANEHRIERIHLTYNAAFHEDLINLHHHSTPFPIMPELIKSYRVDYFKDNRWHELITETNNRVRQCRHQLDEAISTDKIRVVLFETNGSQQFSVNEVRIY